MVWVQGGLIAPCVTFAHGISCNPSRFDLVPVKSLALVLDLPLALQLANGDAGQILDEFIGAATGPGVLFFGRGLGDPFLCTFPSSIFRALTDSLEMSYFATNVALLVLRQKLCRPMPCLAAAETAYLGFQSAFPLSSSFQLPMFSY